jgi:GAF domain-containing protein
MPSSAASLLLNRAQTRYGRNAIVGESISSGKWIIANDLKDSPYHRELASKTKFITRNLICAPIKSLTEQRIAGAIEILNKKGGKLFSREEGELLQEVANCLSMAIENIILNQEILEISNQLNHEIDQIWKEDVQFVAKSHSGYGPCSEHKSRKCASSW